MKRRFFLFEILFFGGIIAISGFSAYQLILGSSNDSTELAADHNTSTETVEQNQDEEANREISSAKDTKTEKDQNQAYKIDCSLKNLKFQTLEPRIRLTGNFCYPKKVNKAPRKPSSNSLGLSIEARNTSNHYEATVFDDSFEKKYSTDFIPLNSGVNEINVDFVDAENNRLKIVLNVTRN